MKENYVILEEEYDEESGLAFVTINTHLGVFGGVTSPDEIDFQYKSCFHANEIALAKALRSFSEAVVNQTKREIKLLEGLLKQSLDCAEDQCDIDNTSFRLINGTLKQKKQELIKWKNRIGGLTKNITDRVAARDKIVAKYIEKDKKD